MNKTAYLFLTFLFMLSVAAAPASAGKLVNKEAVIGAATGGTAGGIIGHQTGHKTEGAILGAITGYAIGTTINRQKQHQKSLEREQAYLHQEIAQQERALAEIAATPPAAPVRELTQSEKQQLLLQAQPLFRVRSND